MTLFHFVIVALMIWLLEALHAIPSWIYGGGYTLMVITFIILAMDWATEKRSENEFRGVINKELWK